MRSFISVSCTLPGNLRVMLSESKLLYYNKVNFSLRGATSYPSAPVLAVRSVLSPIGPHAVTFLQHWLRVSLVAHYYSFDISIRRSLFCPSRTRHSLPLSLNTSLIELSTACHYILCFFFYCASSVHQCIFDVIFYLCLCRVLSEHFLTYSWGHFKSSSVPFWCLSKTSLDLPSAAPYLPPRVKDSPADTGTLLAVIYIPFLPPRTSSIDISPHGRAWTILCVSFPIHLPADTTRRSYIRPFLRCLFSAKQIGCTAFYKCVGEIPLDYYCAISNIFHRCLSSFFFFPATAQETRISCLIKFKFLRAVGKILRILIAFSSSFFSFLYFVSSFRILWIGNFWFSLFLIGNAAEVIAFSLYFAVFFVAFWLVYEIVAWCIFSFYVPKGRERKTTHISWYVSPFKSHCRSWMIYFCINVSTGKPFDVLLYCYHIFHLFLWPE